MTLLQKKQQELNKLYESYLDHFPCPLGRTDQHNIIFGSGNINAKLMIIGEAPGKNEEEQGLPFVGRSGKLLTQCLTTLGLKRDNIFITNIVKCRPQNNRTPTKQEVTLYKNILLRQIEIIKPSVICTLGSTATQALLTTNSSKISLHRGIIYYFNSIPVIPTYHPAYILRNLKKLSEFIQDLKTATTFI